MSEPEDVDTPLGRYFGWFTGALLALLMLLMIARALLQMQLSGIFLITPFIAAIVASDRFVQRERRAPSEDERKRLTFGALGITLFASGFMALAVVSGGGLHAVAAEQDVPMNTIIIIAFSILLSALVMNYLLIRWAFGSIARRRAEYLSKG